MRSEHPRTVTIGPRVCRGGGDLGRGIGNACVLGAGALLQAVQHDPDLVIPMGAVGSLAGFGRWGRCNGRSPRRMTNGNCLLWRRLGGITWPTAVSLRLPPWDLRHRARM